MKYRAQKISGVWYVTQGDKRLYSCESKKMAMEDCRILNLRLTPKAPEDQAQPAAPLKPAVGG